MSNKKRGDRIPYFIQIRGCINCDISKERKKQTGQPFGYYPELMFQCLMCDENYNVTLANPFIDPEESVRLAKKDGQPEVIEKTRKYCIYIKEEFGKYYDKMGVSIDDIINKL